MVTDKKTIALKTKVGSFEIPPLPGKSKRRSRKLWEEYWEVQITLSVTQGIPVDEDWISRRYETGLIYIFNNS